MELQQGERIGTHMEFPSYRVTDAGRVIGKNGRVLVWKKYGNHPFVTIMGRDGLPHRAYISELVASVFLTKPEGKFLVLSHRDKDESNCRAENLEWVEVRLGVNPKLFDRELAPQQERTLNPEMKEAAKDVTKIVEACQAGRGQREIAIEFGITQSMVSSIACAAGIVRRHQLTDSQVSLIHALKAEGKAYTEIAQTIGCSRQVAYLVGTGRRRGPPKVS